MDTEIWVFKVFAKTLFCGKNLWHTKIQSKKSGFNEIFLRKLVPKNSVNNSKILQMQIGTKFTKIHSTNVTLTSVKAGSEKQSYVMVF